MDYTSEQMKEFTERIKELWMTTDTEHHNPPALEWAEKFAELIVQECIGIIEDISPAYNDYRDAIEEAFRIYCVAKIKQDFGIKNERTN